MFRFDDILKTTKRSRWVNTCEYIIIHHTGWWSYESNCKLLSGSVWEVSTHFVIGPSGKCAKIGEPAMILWHAGTSNWWLLNGMNQYALGIEVVGPDKTWKFTEQQYNKLRDLVRYLRVVFKIPVTNVLRHADITWRGAIKKKLWDWLSPARKTDIARTLRADRWYKNFEDFRAKEL